MAEVPAGVTIAGITAPQTLTLKQAAPLASMSVWQLYTRINSPEPPPHIRRGKYILFPTQEFLAWAAQKVIA